mgnify:FL=1
MKKIFVLMFIMLFGFSLAGCTSAVELSAVNTNFSSYYFVADFSSGYGALTESEQAVLKNKVEALASDYLDDIILRYYAALSSFEEQGFITENEKIIYKNHLSSYMNWNDGAFAIELRFASKASSRIFIRSAEYSGAQNETTTFKTVTTEKFKGVFSKTKNNIITTSLEEYFETGAKSALRTLGEETVNKIPNVEFYYMFITQNVKLRAKNANETLEAAGGTVYCFYSNSDYSELEFEFYVVQANRLIYYLICLAIAFIFVAIYLIVIYFKRPKNNLVEEGKDDSTTKFEIPTNGEG